MIPFSTALRKSFFLPKIASKPDDQGVVTGAQIAATTDRGDQGASDRAVAKTDHGEAYLPLCVQPAYPLSAAARLSRQYDFSLAPTGR